MSTDPLEILKVKSTDSVKEGQGADSNTEGRRVTQESTSYNSNPATAQDAQPTSNWTGFCIGIAFLNFILAILGLMLLTARESESRELGKLLTIAGLSAGISTLMLGSMIQLLFECRNYLRYIARIQTNLRLSEKASTAAPKE